MVVACFFPSGYLQALVASIHPIKVLVDEKISNLKTFEELL